MIPAHWQFDHLVGCLQPEKVAYLEIKHLIGGIEKTLMLLEQMF